MCMCTANTSDQLSKGKSVWKVWNTDQIEQFLKVLNSLKTNIASEHRPSQKEIYGNFIFQPLIFRGELLVSWRVNWHF